MINYNFKKFGREPWSSGQVRRLTTERTWFRILAPDTSWNASNASKEEENKRNKGSKMGYTKEYFTNKNYYLIGDSNLSTAIAPIAMEDMKTGVA